MYELSVERQFCAAHAIMIGDRREPVHGHNWRVRVIVAGSELDPNGLLCDFHKLERELERVIGPLHNADLNAAPAFAHRNPTAEHVARHIGDSLAGRLPAGVRLRRVSVEEAPGCIATFEAGAA
ncbi:MAG: 6-carboxytetrahydropterin synthase [Gemmatimonadetes bacterium]|nr:6-carboxytetrahydropterin synthase [Gemmatimonadota bacterium]